MFLIKWDLVRGGVVSMKYPDDLEISEAAVQQIEISHNFIESYITIKESGWSSISFFNEQEEIVIVLVLTQFDDGADYMVSIEEFNKHLSEGLDDDQLLKYLEEATNMKVFRTRDEVIAKLSTEWSDTMMKLNEIENKIIELFKRDFLDVKSRILLSLVVNHELSLKDIISYANTTKQYTLTVLETLTKNGVLKRNVENDTYFLVN